MSWRTSLDGTMARQIACGNGTTHTTTMTNDGGGELAVGGKCITKSCPAYDTGRGLGRRTDHKLTKMNTQPKDYTVTLGGECLCSFLSLAIMTSRLLDGTKKLPHKRPPVVVRKTKSLPSWPK